MRRLFTPGCLLMAAGLVIAQTGDAKLHDAMKQIGPTNGALGKKIAAKDSTSTDDAKKLQALFEDVTTFWEGRETEDAVEFSKTAVAQFQMVAQLVKDGKWEEGTAALKKVGASCMGCHAAHREKAPDGSWKIK